MIAKMSDQQGQVKRKQLTLDFLCQDKINGNKGDNYKYVKICTHL